MSHPLHTRTRSRLLARLLIAGAVGMTTLSGWAQTFPNKPIRWVVVAPAGSSLDVIARAMQDRLKDLLGQAVVVDNKPQAGGTLGTAEVAKSAPDGHTWVMSYNGPLAFGPHLYPKLPYQPLRDLQPVMITTSQPNVIAAHAEFPANSMRELVSLLKQHPGQYNFASVGNGSASHLTMEYIKALTGTFAVHIPFNGSPPAVMATVAGQTQLMASVPTALAPQVKQGRLKYLAVTSAQRYPLLPDVPTVASTAGGLPLKGMCTAKVPVTALMYSIVRCDALPLPTEAKLYWPGCCLSWLTNSRMVLAGNWALAAITLGCEVVIITGCKSRSGW